MLKKTVKHIFIIGCITKLLGILYFFDLPKAYAKFDEKRLYVTNVVLPAGMAALRAHFEGTSIKDAIIQAIFGGYIMQESLKKAAKIEKKSAWYAWETKLMFNLGASLCESAGLEKFTFKMDIGPIWLIGEDNKFKFKYGINGVIAPIFQLSDGSKFDYKQSLKYGTFVFKRKSHSNGHLYGSDQQILLSLILKEIIAVTN